MKWTNIGKAVIEYSWWVLAGLVIWYQLFVVPGYKYKAKLGQLQTFMIGYEMGASRMNYDIIPYTRAMGVALSIDSSDTEKVMDWFFTEDADANKPLQ